MKFPEWVDSPHLSEEQRAINRLQFLVAMLCLLTGPRANMRELSRVAGVDASNMCRYIKRGAFSINSAMKIEAATNYKGVAQMLVDPLNAKALTV